MQGEPGQWPDEMSWPDQAQGDCSQALVVLHSYLDGELSVERHETIQFHLESCSHCFGAFDFELELRMIVRSRVRDQVPDEVRRRVIETIMIEQQTRALRERSVSPGEAE